MRRYAAAQTIWLGSKGPLPQQGASKPLDSCRVGCYHVPRVGAVSRHVITGTNNVISCICIRFYTIQSVMFLRSTT